MKIDWKLKGFNLARFTCNKNAVLHPETCSDMVLMNHDDTSPLSLKNWITNNGATEMDSSLGACVARIIGDQQFSVDAQYHTDIVTGLNIGYIGGNSSLNNIKVPFGSNISTGVVSIGTGLTATATGNISVAAATTNDYGGIKLGFAEQDSYKPVILSDEGKAYVNIGNVSSTLKYWNGTSIQTTSQSATVYHEPEVQTSGLGSRFSELYSQKSLDILYPVCADTTGLLYSIVPSPTINVPEYGFESLGTMQFRVRKNNQVFQDVTIYPDPSNITGTGNSGRLALFDSTYHIISGPALGSGTTTYLRNDGTWHTPTNTQYGSDEDTILMNESNKFSDPHQHTAISDKPGQLSNDGLIDNKEIFTETNGLLSFSNIDTTDRFKKTDCIVIEIESRYTNTDVRKDIEWILSCFGQSSPSKNTKGTLTYRSLLVKEDPDFEVVCDSNYVESFYNKYASGDLVLNIYGDITATYIDHALTFSFDTSSSAHMLTLTFDYISDRSDKEYLNIVCDLKPLVSIATS